MMVFKAFSALFVLALVNAEKYIQYPSGDNPCIMANLTTSILLTWTDHTGTAKKSPVFSLDEMEVKSGQCNSTPSVTLERKDGATMMAKFFLQPDQSVSVTADLAFTMTPSVVFNNTDRSKITFPSTNALEVGTNETSYKCVSQVTVPFDEEESLSNNNYSLSMNISNLRIQAFGITSKTYNTAVTECAQDPITTGGPTTEPTPTTKPTTEHTPTTKPTTEHTPTTKPTTEHTPTTKPTTEHAPTTEHTATPANGTTVPPHSPTNTPTTIPTTTAPSPDKHPNQTFMVHGPKNTICLLMIGEFQYSIFYPSNNNTNLTASFGVNASTTTGNCNNASDELDVYFNDDWEMVLTVKGDKKSFMWESLNLTFNYATALFPDVHHDLVGKNKTIGVVFTKETFKAGVSQSYLCNSEQTLQIEDGSSLNVWDFQYKAFKEDNSTTFDKNGDKIMQCSKDAKTNSVVPIAVGAALAGLVVIVLIAYLIGRRRNRKGYESV